MSDNIRVLVVGLGNMGASATTRATPISTRR